MIEIKVKSVDDMLDVIESLTGYTPDGMLTAVYAGGNGWRPRIHGAALRSDDEVDAMNVSLARNEVLGVAIWGEQEHENANRVAAHLGIMKPHVPIVRATRTHWWWPSISVHRYQRKPSQAKAAMVFNGIDSVVAPDKQTMISSMLLPEPKYGEVEILYPPVAPAEGGAWVADRLVSKYPLTQYECAAVIGATQLPSVKDHIVEYMCQLLLAEEVMTLERVRMRLVEVAAEAADDHRARLFRLIAIAFYLLGYGPLASASLDMAEEYEPGHAFTAVLRHGFTSHVPPEDMAAMIIEAMEEVRDGD